MHHCIAGNTLINLDSLLCMHLSRMQLSLKPANDGTAASLQPNLAHEPHPLDSPQVAVGEAQPCRDGCADQRLWDVGRLPHSQVSAPHVLYPFMHDSLSSFCANSCVALSGPVPARWLGPAMQSLCDDTAHGEGKQACGSQLHAQRSRSAEQQHHQCKSAGLSDSLLRA